MLKTNKILLATMIIVFLGLISCKKKVEDGSPEFIGHWFTQPTVDMHLDIDISETSHAIYRLNSDGKETVYKGAARANSKTLKIGSIRHFDIIEYPHQIDTTVEKHLIYNSDDNTYKLATWKMTLFGIKPNDNQFCGEEEYYKADY